MFNSLVGLLTLRLLFLRWVFLASSLRLRFHFYLGPLSPGYLLVATQGLAAYSCFTTQSFGYSLKDLLVQLSVVSLYSDFMRTFVPPLHLQSWRTGFFSSLSFGPGFEFWQCLGSLGRI